MFRESFGLGNGFVNMNAVRKKKRKEKHLRNDEIFFHVWSLIYLYIFVSFSFQEPVSAPVEKFYFLNVNRVEYTRETLTPTPAESTPDPNLRDKPNHRLVVHGLKVGVSLRVCLPFLYYTIISILKKNIYINLVNACITAFSFI